MKTTGLSVSRSIVFLTFMLLSVGGAFGAPFTFVSMADSRGSDNGVNDAVLSGIVSQVLADSPAFVMFPGDLVTGSSDAVTLTTQLNHWRDVMDPLYASGMYGAGVFAGPGNHEIRNAASEPVWQTIFSDLPASGPAGETYMTYSLDYGNSHFIMLDTNRDGNHHTVNQAWLAADLAATTAEHIFVFGHEPAYPAGPHVGSSLDAYPAERDAFWDLLADYDVDAYFAGHEHLYNYVMVDGIHQIIDGTCGAPVYTGYGGDFYHYALVTVDGRYVSIQIIDDDGDMRDLIEYSTVPAPAAILLGVFGVAGVLARRRRS